jgi:hypothetical protein
MFRVGQKCICVEYERKDNEVDHIPVVGRVYTIADAWIDSDGDKMVDLVELPFGGDDHFDPGYMAKCFRPIVSRPTSIAVFEEILRSATRTDEVKAHG